MTDEDKRLKELQELNSQMGSLTDSQKLTGVYLALHTLGFLLKDILQELREFKKQNRHDLIDVENAVHGVADNTRRD